MKALVRRTAEIFLFDADDYESMFAKYGMNGIWTDDQLEQHKKVGKMLEDQNIKPEWFDEVTQHTEEKFILQEIMNDLYSQLASVGKEQAEGINAQIAEASKQLNNLVSPRSGLDHRRMSNNSIAFGRKPDESFMDLVFELMQLEGEPGFVNLEEAAKRVLKNLGIDNPTRSQLDNIIYQIGLNPCVEVILFSKNVCNLTTINLKAFVENGKLKLGELIQAQKYSTRIGLRMTLATLELPNWDKIQQRDRLLGVSLTGWKDAMGMLKFTKEQEDELKYLLHEVAREEADNYSKQLRVNSPLFVTAVKPEGTLSQVAGGVSSGLHWSHSPYFIRRIRVNNGDPLAKVADDLGWTIHAEVGTNDYMNEEDLKKPEQIKATKTLVIDFPVESGANVTKDDITVDAQFDNYFSFQDLYTDMNTSNTITVKPDEWKQAQKRVWDGWDNFVGVSFLALDGGTYTLAPYEAISKEQHDALKASMKPFDPTLLRNYEASETELDLDSVESCSSGVCPVR